MVIINSWLIVGKVGQVLWCYKCSISLQPAFPVETGAKHVHLFSIHSVTSRHGSQVESQVIFGGGSFGTARE